MSIQDSGVLTPNRSVEESTRHCLKWVARAILATLQTSYPLGRSDARADGGQPLIPPPIHAFSSTPKRGRIVLLGSGLGPRPAHPPHTPNTHYLRGPRVGEQTRLVGCAFLNFEDGVAPDILYFTLKMYFTWSYYRGFLNHMNTFLYTQILR